MLISIINLQKSRKPWPSAQEGVFNRDICTGGAVSPDPCVRVLTPRVPECGCVWSGAFKEAAMAQ